jgi:hypothetical protein
MALTVQEPTDGTLLIIGALALTTDADVATAEPTDGALPIIGAVVVGEVTGGAFVLLNS